MDIESDLPSEYDVIILGTGMTESIVAAAVSRIGKKVLHLDKNDYYGDMWASFNFDALKKWLEDGRVSAETSEHKDQELDKSLLKPNETTQSTKNHGALISNIKESWKKSGEPDAGPDVWTEEKVKETSRKFNLDLAPKLLFSRGPLVELLISSNIARYAEFRAVNRILTWFNSKLEVVPCSRADVFSTKEVSVVEKRVLMKLLSLCMDYKPDGSEFRGFENSTFLEYLKSKDLTENILHYVLYAIAMSNENTPCMEGVKNAQKFLGSLGRYGNTPFLWPMYGSGELPQCFCRLCAVFGGVYHLQRKTEALIVTDAGSGKRCVGIVSNGQRLEAQYILLNFKDAPSYFFEKGVDQSGVSRAIFITDKSILKSDKEPLTFLEFPRGGKESITVIELGPSTHACPAGLFVVHMTCKQDDCAEKDLQPAVEALFSSQESEGDVEKPKPLWSLYFNLPDTSKYSASSAIPSNVFLACGPDADIDFELAVGQAKEIFEKMYPNCDFLPRAPDPEEIILEGEDN